MRFSSKFFTASDSSSLLRGILSLTFGSGAARAILILSMPLLTRIYGPEDFGTLSVFNAIVLLVFPIMSLRYVIAVPIPRKDATAANLMVLNVALIGVFLVVFAVLFWSTAGWIDALLSVELMSSWWWLVVLATVGAALAELLFMWGTRKKSYKDLAAVQIIQAFSRVLVKIGLGLMMVQPGGLLAGQIIFYLSAVFALFGRFKSDIGSNIGKINSRRILFLLLHFREFAFFRTPAHFLMIFSTQAPILFVSSAYGGEVAGQIGLATMAMTIPASIFAQSIGSVVYAEASGLGKQQPGQIRDILVKITIYTALGVSIPILTVFLFGPQIFSLILGNGWHQAGQFASVLSIYLFFQICCVPVINVLNVIGGQMAVFIVSFVRAALVVLAFTVAYWWDLKPSDAMLVYSVFLSASYFGAAGFVFRTLTNRKAKLTDQPIDLI